jgi:hypothetical protein
MKHIFLSQQKRTKQNKMMEQGNEQGNQEGPESRLLNAILSGMDKELNLTIQTGDMEQIKAVQEKQLAILQDLLKKAFSEITRLLQYSGVDMKTGQAILGFISDTNNIWITITGRSMLELRINKLIDSAEEKGVKLPDLNNEKDKGGNYSPIILN